jgi:hypothetical protein
MIGWVRIHKKVVTNFQPENGLGRNLFGDMFVDESLKFVTLREQAFRMWFNLNFFRTWNMMMNAQVS